MAQNSLISFMDDLITARMGSRIQECMRVAEGVGTGSQRGSIFRIDPL